MGNVMSMGYNTPSDAADAPAQDDYVQRLSAEDLKRYTEGFRRVCRVDADHHGAAMGGGQLPPLPAAAPAKPPRRVSGNGSVNPVNGAGFVANIAGGSGSPGLSKKLFRSKLLSAFPLIPHSLSDRLFDVLDTDQRSELSVETVLRGIALLKHGTRDEHLQLLFTIYDLDSTGLVARDVLDRFMDVIYGRKRARNDTTVRFLNGVFKNRATLTIEEFKEIAEEKDDNGQAVLLQWLYALSDRIGRIDDDQIVELEKQYNPVVIRHRIAEMTLFSTSEVSTLEKQFHKLFDTKGGASNRIPCEQFIDLLTQHEFPQHILEKACEAHRMTVPGMVLFDEFCQILSDYCRGMAEPKCRRLFQLYSSGVSEHDKCERRIARYQVDELLCAHVNGSMNGGSKMNGHSKHGHHPDAALLLKADQTWSEDDFVEWATTSPLLQDMLHRMAFAACILFGIKPDSAYLEKKIVEWHWRDATREVFVGQTWNFLASKWWLQWCKFVGMDETNGTQRATTLCVPQLPREAVWVDEGAGDDDGLSQVVHASRPGTIANWSLLKRSGSRRLKEKLLIGRDFHLVPSSVYAVLSQWYSGGPELTRAVIELPNGVKQVELFPLVLRVARVDSSSGGVILSGEEVTLSTLSTVDGLLQAACKALLLTKFADKARLWYFDENHPDHKYRLRNSRPKELKRLIQSSVFLVEIQDDDGSWPLSQSADIEGHVVDDDEDGELIDSVRTSSRKIGDATQPPPLTRRTSDICSRGNLESLTALGSSRTSTAARDGVIKPATVVEDEGLATARTLKRRFSRNAFTGSGLVGLDNLGNTCYMSSALQCMSHTRLLVDYFKNEEYLHDINLHNRDGTNGKLAVAFGELLRVLWTSEKKRFAPTEFKRVLSRFNPQFSGSDQHDAQELLAYLLSGLSEDLNRVVKKPYIEQPDSDGRCDTVVANEWWHNHSKREFSVIVALFTGQYKSLLECSICHYESARFEPFTFLQLSLPESSYRSIVATVIFNNGRVPMKYSVRVRNEGCIQDVQDEVINLIRRMDKRDGVPPRNDIHVILARVSSLHTVEAILEPKTPLIRIHERDQLTAYELDDVPHEEVTKMSLASFTHEERSPITKLLEVSSQTEESEQSESVVTDTESPTSRASSPTGSDRQTAEGDEEELKPNVHTEVDCGPFAVGTSVYVRADKARDFLAARVIGGSTKNGPTVDVAYPSGVRRYHIPLSKVLERRREEAFVFLVHRRVERSMNSFAEAHITRLFGAPLTLRVSLRTTSNFDLYMLVWNRLRRIFNWQTPPTPQAMDAMLREHMGSEDEEQQRQLRRTGLSTVALGRHLTWTKFGFSLRMVTSHGIGCSRCEWIEGCLGCVILPSPSMRIELSAEETIAIDWDIRTLKEEYDPIQASKMDTHESVQINHRLDNMPLNIHRCLDIFTAKEHINEAYCGRCKTHRPATKTMDLWRLPPILVIQLKRFCFTQTSRRKLHHLVDFPLKGLRLEDFVAKKRDPKRFHETGLVYWRFLGGKLREFDQVTDSPLNSADGVPPQEHTSGSEPLVSPKGTLMDAPATAAERADESFLYDLYGVVNHVGALGAGHYFAYVLNEEDNKWKCFNDHQCKEIDAKEVVSSSAYILFYRRRDMKDVPIETLFPPIRRKTKANADEDDTAADEDQAKVEELVEQSKLATNGSSCVIS